MIIITSCKLQRQHRKQRRVVDRGRSGEMPADEMGADTQITSVPQKHSCHANGSSVSWCQSHGADPSGVEKVGGRAEDIWENYRDAHQEQAEQGVGTSLSMQEYFYVIL
jgi:hypothetical protein